jgi:hypothetical protein
MSATTEAIDALLEARQRGLTLRQAAAAAGVHVATVMRWQAKDSQLREALRVPLRERPTTEPRPWVEWRRDCPRCQAKVVVRTARGGARFWRCGRWPWCKWASWRPRAPRNCRNCGGPRFWSHSRKSIVCGGCGVRTRAP